MKRSWLRALPALLVGVLLVLAVLAPSRRAGARSGPETIAAYYPGCDYVLQQGGGGGTLYFGPAGWGITQPLNVVGNVAACSLGLQPPPYSAGWLQVFEWDPLTLAPDPTTVALRSRAFTASELQYNHVRADFNPPIVTRPVPHLADPPRTTIAFDYRVTSPYNGQTVYYEGDGAPTTPGALQYPSGGSRTALPGPHPVLSHAVCGGDALLQSLYLVQSVMTTDIVMEMSNNELMQRFRVPVPALLHWVEVAFGQIQYFYPYNPGTIAILDAQGQSAPPPSLPGSLVEAYFSQNGVSSPFWGSHFDFDHLITLEPNHDYWLLARTNFQHGLYARFLTGGESADFTSNIGPFFRRANQDPNWLPVPDKALCFRLVGYPLEAISVPSAAQSPSALRLQVTPNPARGAAVVSWAGATGSLRFEVLDARGRRVGGAAALAGAAGRWSWPGADDEGRPLPAGVYFVRATDGGGRAAVDRVVLIR